MLVPGDVITYPNPQLFVLMDSFNLIVVYINCGIEIAAATRPASGNKHVISLVTVYGFWRVHWEMRFTSYWKVERCWQDIGLKSNKSSAYIIRCESLENGRLGISFTYSKNKRGPRMDPWGTPDVTGNQDEQVPFSTTRWKRSDR